ncbi:MAG: hypothetical protein KH452_13335 [Clostridiales bacterium]|nr:hypothetical protein [Clostridiales bacterium]
MELSFGEQIKIILKRKNMTIRELADLYTERTGTPMSRQNLTQRLKRDNFPEQDMHVIAALLGFHVSVRLTPVTAAIPGTVHEESAAPILRQELPVPARAGAPLQETPAPAQRSSSGITFQIPDAFRKPKPQGDINPLTGEEYLSNTVRCHPQIEEYVQVYDRSTHEWSDVREDYFWEFQEKKKQMLGKDYRAPIRI